MQNDTLEKLTGREAVGASLSCLQLSPPPSWFVRRKAASNGRGVLVVWGCSSVSDELHLLHQDERLYSVVRASVGTRAAGVFTRTLEALAGDLRAARVHLGATQLKPVWGD